MLLNEVRKQPDGLAFKKAILSPFTIENRKCQDPFHAMQKIFLIGIIRLLEKECEGTFGQAEKMQKMSMTVKFLKNTNSVKLFP